MDYEISYEKESSAFYMAAVFSAVFIVLMFAVFCGRNEEVFGKINSKQVYNQCNIYFSQEIFDDYSQNIITANKKYAFREITLVGKICDIKKDKGKFWIYIVPCEKNRLNAEIFIDAGSLILDDKIGIAKGDTIAVRGVMENITDGNRIYLKGSFLEKSDIKYKEKLLYYFKVMARDLQRYTLRCDLFCNIGVILYIWCILKKYAILFLACI